MAKLSPEISKKILDKTSCFLYEKKLIPVFVSYYRKYKCINPIVYQGAVYSHNVHHKEGKQVRDFLKTLSDCDDWTVFDFDKLWSEIVEIIIRKVILHEKLSIFPHPIIKVLKYLHHKFYV